MKYNPRLALRRFLDLLCRDIQQNPSALEPYTEEEAAEDDELLAGVEVEESFRRGWQECMNGETIPVSRLWEEVPGCDAPKTITLSEAATVEFINALENPPDPPKSLADGMKEFWKEAQSLPPDFDSSMCRYCPLEAIGASLKVSKGERLPFDSPYLWLACFCSGELTDFRNEIAALVPDWVEIDNVIHKWREMAAVLASSSRLNEDQED